MPSCPSIPIRLFSRKTLGTPFSDDKIPKFLAAAAAHQRRPPPARLSNSFHLLKSLSRSLKLPLPNPNVFFYNTLLNSLVVARRPRGEVEALFDQMIDSGITPTTSSFTILLKLQFLLQNDSDSVYEMVNIMIRYGCYPDSVTYLTLIAGLCRVGRVEEAWGVFDCMIEDNCPPSVRSYASFVLGYCYLGRIEEAKRVMYMMESVGCPPDTVTYTILIDALCQNGDFDEVERVLGESASKGWKPNEVTYTVYMNGLCKMGRADEAFRQLDVMRETGLCPTIEILNVLFDGLCRNSKVWEAKCLLERSSELDWDVDVFFYNTLISRLYEVGAWMTVLKVLTDMIKKGISPDACTFTIVIRSLCKNGKLRKAKCIIFSEGFVVDIVAFNTLLHGFYMAREFGEVHLLFLEMLKENIVPNKFSYGINLDSYCRGGKYLDAVNCLLGSIENRFLPDLVARLIRWLVKDGKFREILHLLEEMMARRLLLNFLVFNSLIRAFCRKGFCQSVESYKLYLILDKMLGIR